MIKKNHRIKALLLAAYLTLCFHFAPFSASAASQTDTGNLIGERINFLIKNLNGRYFTTDGTSTGNSYNVSVANSGWFQAIFGEVNTNGFPAHACAIDVQNTGHGWSCSGFASFAEWFIFRRNNSDVVTCSTVAKNVAFTYENLATYARPGDVIQLQSAAKTDGHSLIFLSCTPEKMEWLDCNYARDCKVVHWNASYSAFGYTRMSISRADNYYELSTVGSSTPSSATIPGALTLTNKANFTTTEDVVIYWNAVSEASFYGLTVRNNDTGYIVCDGDYAGTSKNLGKLSAGTYIYQARAGNSAGWGPLTTVKYFTVTNETEDSYASLPVGKYRLKNGASGYLTADVSLNSSTALTISDATENNNQLFIVSEANSALSYSFTPQNITNGRVNVWTDYSSVNGNKVTIWENTGHDSQLWVLEAYGSGYLIHPKDNVSLALTNNNGSACVKTTNKASNQIWSLESPAVSYTVSFNANGGSVSPSSKSVTNGKTYGSLPTPVCPGYTFTGWFTESSGGTRVIESQKVTLTSNQTLFAQWAEKTVTNIGNVPNSINVVVAHNYALSPSISPSDARNKSLTFTSSNSAVASVTSTGIITGIAQGTATITVKAASGISKSITVAVGAQKDWSGWVSALPSNITNANYDIESRTVYRYRDNTITSEYGEWSVEKTTESKPTESDTLMIVNTTTYYNYYHYCCNYYDGMYNVDSISYGSGPHYYHTIKLSKELSVLNLGDKGGKTLFGDEECNQGFVAWAKANPYETYVYTYKTRTCSNKTVYGTWSNWQTSQPSRQEKREIESGTEYRYKLKKFTVSYDANGGIGAPVPQTKYTGEALTLSSTIPIWGGHIFLGWATSTNGSVIYQAGGTYTTDAAATLFAVWKTETYSINFNLNGGTGSFPTMTKTYGSDMTLPGIVPQKTGYTFIGWRNEQGLFEPGVVYCANGETVLNAEWSVNQYTVAFNGNGGIVDLETKTYCYNSELTMPIPSRPGFDFSGWYTAASGGTEMLEGTEVQFTTDQTLYAHWEPWPFYMDAVLIAMNVGETETILVSVDPNDFSNTQLFGITSWVSEDDSIATVTNGEVTGISAGKTIIHAIASNGKKNDCTVIVREATTQCSVSLCCDGSGAVYGDGLYLIGDFAKVTAVPSWGMTFCGWYQDGILVSSDTEYGFFIMNDAELTAKFAGIDNVSVAIVGTGGSYADIHVFNHEAVDLIVAVYNVEGQMLSVQTRNLQAFEGGDIQINMGIEIIDSAHQVKVFAVSCTKCEPCTTCDSSK